jgi:hypothetical protein
MADLIIKPSVGTDNKLIIQNQAGNAILTTGNSATDTILAPVAGHTLDWTSYEEPSTSLSLASLGQSSYNILVVGGTVRSATVLAGNKLWITMSGGYIKFAGTNSQASGGFIYTTSGTDPVNVAHGSTVPSTVVLNGYGSPSTDSLSFRGIGSVSYLYENTTSSSVTVKFCPCIKNQGANWAWLQTDAQHQINFSVVSIEG